MLNEVYKRFDKTQAVANLSLEVRRDELFGLIGPDGAGKSTLLRLLAGVLQADSGGLSIFGESPRENRLNVGYMTQHFSLYPELSVKENMRYFAGTRRVPASSYQQRKNQLLQLFGLDQFEERLAGQLSGGMKQKLSLCCAMIFEPALLILDEPTTGLDPLSRREFWQLLSQVAQGGVTILIATPNFSEAELCDRVALINKGQILSIGEPNALRKELGISRLEIHSGNIGATSRLISTSLMTDLAGLVCDMNVYGDRIELLTRESHRVKAIVEEICVTEPDLVCLFEDATLENVFVMNAVKAVPPTESVPSPRTIQNLRSANDRVAIAAKGLSRRFGDFSAVEDLSISIDYGEIYGLLGANGAGKTTTIKMLCRLIEPTSGELSVSSSLEKSAFRSRLGYMSQKFTLYEDLSAIENLRFYASAYSVPGHLRREKIEWAISTSDLHSRSNVPVKSLPQALKQRIAFCSAVLHDPEILFLDEPTSGLDPISRRQFWKIIREFADAGTAILVTTHFLDDAEYCNRLGLMVNGKLIAEGAPAWIKAHCQNVLEIVLDDVHSAYKYLSSRMDPAMLSVFPRRLRVQSRETDCTNNTIVQHLQEAGIEFGSCMIVPPSLEDAFIHVVRSESNKVARPLCTN